MLPDAAAGAAPGIASTGAARSSTLPPSLAARMLPAFDMYARANVQTKNTDAQAAVERDRKFALPVAPNRLPEEPPPKEAPMSAPLPCWTSTRPIIVSADSSCTASTKVIQVCMIERLQKNETRRGFSSQRDKWR